MQPVRYDGRHSSLGGAMASLEEQVLTTLTKRGLTLSVAETTVGLRRRSVQAPELRT